MPCRDVQKVQSVDYSVQELYIVKHIETGSLMAPRPSYCLLTQ